METTTADQQAVSTHENTTTASTTADEPTTTADQQAVSIHENTTTASTTADEPTTNVQAPLADASTVNESINVQPPTTDTGSVQQTEDVQPPPTTDTGSVEQIKDVQPPPTNASTVNEPIDIQPPPTTDTGSVEKTEDVQPPPPPTDTGSVEQTEDVQPPPTNASTVNESINVQPPSPINASTVNEPIDVQPPPTDVGPVEQTEDVQPLTKNNIIDDNTTDLPSSVTNTIHVDEPQSIQQLTTNIATINKPINLQQPSTSIAIVNETKNLQSPPTKTAIAVDNAPLLFLPVEPEATLVKDTTIPKNVEDTVVADNAVNLTTKTSNKSPVTDIRKSSRGIVFAGIILFISFLQLIIGWRYADDCPIHWRIPHYLVVAGSVGLAFITLVIVKRLLKFYIRSKPSGSRTLITSGYSTIRIVIIVLVIFIIGWWIAGCIWVFRVWGKVQYTDQQQSNYCHPTLYRFAFWLLLIIIFYVAFIVYRIFKGRHKLSADKKKGAPTLVPTSEP